MDLVEQYRAGQRWRVWHQLRELGSRVRDDYRHQAQAVCDEMARRARHNIELLVERLVSQGFVFHSNDDHQTPMAGFIPATDEAGDLVQWLDQQPFGPIPLVVSSWIRLVGDVWFVGTHPQWPESDAADPLVVQLEGTHFPVSSMSEVYTSEYGAWQDWSESDPDAAAFVLPVSPDRLHKQNVSGGPAYGFLVPDGCADALFIGETTMPFVSYLNLVFANGGFPASDTGGWMLKTELSKGLLAL